MGGDLGGKCIALVDERGKRDIVLQTKCICQDATGQEDGKGHEPHGGTARTGCGSPPALPGFRSRTFFRPVADTMTHAIRFR